MATITKTEIAFDKTVRAGHIKACAELDATPCHILSEGNPNHPNYDLQLFGMNHADFMARQYR